MNALVADAGAKSLRARLRELTPWIPSKLPLVFVAAAGVVSGLLEGLVVTLIAVAAGALATGDELMAVDVGPVDIELAVRSGLLFGIAATVVMIVVKLASGWVLAEYGSVVLTRTRMRLMDDYLSAPFEEQKNSVQAELHDLIVIRSLRLTQVVMLFVAALSALFSFVAMVGLALVLAPLTAGALVGTTGVIAIAFRPLLRRTHDAGTEHMQSQVDVGVVVGDAAGLLAETHVYGAKEGLLERASVSITDGGRSFRTAAFANQVGLAGYVGVVLVLLLGGLLAVVEFEVGDPTTLGAIALLMLRGLRQSQGVQSNVQAASELYPNVSAISELTDRLRHRHVADGGAALDRIDVIRFVGASYRYPDTEDGVTGLDLELSRGELIGVVGPSGAGKSTFAELVMGLRSPTDGHIEVNGRPRDEFDRDDWFQRVAYVAQDPRLLEGSVAENVAFFREADDRAVLDVLGRAAMGNDLERWAEGLDRRVGIGGQDLSGGQRQRMAIARALVDAPDVVVFDEPTSALDPKSELHVRETLAELGRHALVLLISHRPSTLALCQRILVFEDGHVEEIASDALGGALESGQFADDPAGT